MKPLCPCQLRQYYAESGRPKGLYDGPTKCIPIGDPCPLGRGHVGSRSLAFLRAQSLLASVVFGFSMALPRGSQVSTRRVVPWCMWAVPEAHHNTGPYIGAPYEMGRRILFPHFGKSNVMSVAPGPNTTHTYICRHPTCIFAPRSSKRRIPDIIVCWPFLLGFHEWQGPKLRSVLHKPPNIHVLARKTPGDDKGSAKFGGPQSRSVSFWRRKCRHLSWAPAVGWLLGPPQAGAGSLW